MKNLKQKFKRSVLHTLVFGSITGTVCGAVIALFLVCSRIVMDFAFGVYAVCDTALAVVCIFILAVICCLLTAVVQTLCPTSKGSGIPLAEGSARGMLRIRWLSSAAALIAGSLLSFACGMPLGSEGPSVGIGGLIGEGVGKTAKKPVEFRRYLITGGSCAGLAAAFNAPLTGICFAFEETHRRFSPYILASALSAVIFAVLTSQSIFYGLQYVDYLSDIGISAGFAVLPYLKQSPFSTVLDLLKMCGIALACGIVAAAFGIGFNRAIVGLGKLFGKVKSATLRLLPAFLLSAGFGCALYFTAGSGEATLESVSTDTAMWLLITVLIMRFAATATASGAAATGGLFLPMIAIGGLIGTVISKIAVISGLDPAYVPNITVICICAFFASSVRAPITAIALSIELTASFVSILPCLVAVAASAVLTDLTKTEPLYERMLEDLKSRTPLPDGTKNLAVRGGITEDSPIAHMRIRNIMWPYNSLVTELRRDGKDLVPDGETELLPGDIITLRAENVDPDWFIEQTRELVLTDYSTNIDEPPPGNAVLTARNL